MIAEKFEFYKNEVEQFGNLEKWVDKLSADRVATGYPDIDGKATEKEKEMHEKAKAQYIEDNTFTDEQIAELKKIAPVVETKSKK